MKLTVMTFNLRREGLDDGLDMWMLRKQATVKAIREADPWIVGTQEGYSEMLRYMERELPYFSWLGSGRHGGNRNEHNAIFYRRDLLEVVEQGQFWLSEEPDVPASRSWGSSHSRICTWAHFRAIAGDGGEFAVFNTHLDYRSQEARERGIGLVWDAMRQFRERKPLPLVLTGDLNSEPDTAVVTFLRGGGGLPHEPETRCALKDAYSALDGEPGLTFHHFKGGESGEPIDYIFVSPEVSVSGTAVNRSRYGGKWPSDHYPVKTVLHFS
ncbi:MAG: endonuclease/exonuclease/phosphatase family protein [Paenibacillaceae bacterium]|nr:endonuclease/exonuclease/phosphatase family protein [Paenibacillaceae bacterium]